MKMINIKQLIENATQALYRGDFTGAESFCRQALMINQDNADNLHILGIICGQQGKLEDAVNYISKAIDNDPKNHIYYSNLGEMLRRMGKLQEAADTFRKAINLKPDFAGIKYNLANTLKAQGKFSEAIRFYNEAIQLDPEDPQSMYNLGNTLNEIGEYQQAINAYQAALRVDPNLHDAHYNCARALQELNRWEEAIYHNKQSVRIKPDFAEAWRSLGIIYETQSQVDEAKENYQALFKLEPDNIGLQLHIETISPLINFSNYEIDNYRNNLLKTVDKYVSLDIKIDLKKIYENFHPASTLIYHGRQDADLKRKYAGIFKNSFSIVETPLRGILPDGQAHGPAPTNNNSLTPHSSPFTFHGQRPHIGFVVTHGHEGIFIKCMKGIINNLKDFNITIICDPLSGTRKIKPELTEPTVRLLDLPKNFDEMVQKIRNANCDLIYYWEVGTDTTNYFLPFFKLAPIQCTGWGWPVTTGIPQMDYFISSEILETEGSEKLYTENLIKLKSLPAYYYRPVIPTNLKPRSYFGFSDTDHIYFCMQNLRKVHPDFDQVIADILARDPAGIVVFTEDKHPHITTMVKYRLLVAQPEAASRIRFMKRIPADVDYLNFLALTDVVLDTLHYSGTNTTYEAFAAGIPVVTLPGPSIRGRYTYGTYKVIGIDDGIAESEEDYVNKSVRIACEPGYRKQLSKRILDNCGVLFENKAAIDELAEFFKSALLKKNE
jgi:protein O-GlcNAc transferase